MENSLNEKPNNNEIQKNISFQKKGSRRISEVVPIYSQLNKINLKGRPDIENLLINNQESISYNNINILKTDLPNILPGIKQMQIRNNKKMPTGKSVDEKKYINNSRNIDMFNHSLGDDNILDNEKFNTTMQIRGYTSNKITNYNGNDNNLMNISELVWQKSKNMGFVNTSKNKNSRNINNNNYINKNNYLTQIGNTNSFTTKNTNEKLKFTVNKQNIINKIKKPTKIKIEKKNLKYKIPLDFMNNLGNKKKIELNNNRKLNLKQRNINNNRSFSNIKNKNKNIIDYQNKRGNDPNDSKSFIESTLVAFNGLVSKAQEIGQILIDNKEIINDNKDNDLISNQLKNSIEILNVDKKIDKLDKKIKNERKTVEELQKINLDLNNKINLFNENSQQYEYKVKELSDVINQLRLNSSNNVSNNNSNNSNGDNNYSTGGNHNLLMGDSITKFIPCSATKNFLLERKAKRKKIRFGFVESIFMKPDKFQIITNKKPNKTSSYIEDNNFIKKSKKEPKLVFVNMNKNNDNYKNITNEEYQDAAEQMANQLLIESLISLKNEDSDND